MSNEDDRFADWFPVRIVSVLSGLPLGYLFQEVWALPGGAVADKIGGRVNSVNDPGYTIDGKSFFTTAAGTPVQALARRAVGAGGVQWELQTVGGLPNAYGTPSEAVNSAAFHPIVGPGGGWADFLVQNIPIGWHAVFAMGYFVVPVSVTVGIGFAIFGDGGVGQFPESIGVCGYSERFFAAAAPTYYFSMSSLVRVTKAAAFSVYFNQLPVDVTSVKITDLFAIQLNGRFGT